MRPVLALVIVSIYVSCVYTERCSDASSCVGTLCVSTAEHAHIQCIEEHCTCVEDALPCLQSADCKVGKCIDRDGHDTDWHCLDGNCTCIRV